jgi:hypothetical protein
MGRAEIVLLGGIGEDFFGLAGRLQRCSFGPGVTEACMHAAVGTRANFLHGFGEDRRGIPDFGDHALILIQIAVTGCIGPIVADVASQ